MLDAMQLALIGWDELCRCWQGSENLQAVCEVLLEEASWPLLHALRKACSKNIKFSHCALSFGDQAPLRSEQCFTSNQTDSAGVPRSNLLQ